MEDMRLLILAGLLLPSPLFFLCGPDQACEISMHTIIEYYPLSMLILADLVFLYLAGKIPKSIVASGKPKIEYEGSNQIKVIYNRFGRRVTITFIGSDVIDYEFTVLGVQRITTTWREGKLYYLFIHGALGNHFMDAICYPHFEGTGDNETLLDVENMVRGDIIHARATADIVPKLREAMRRLPLPIAAAIVEHCAYIRL